ncbi:hypothetical protein [Hymenobacter radiodurans]|uniref:hypothetical protein n=1 Tax=Hymenobacter radiodurans TaxID=2496028 RepID=UPI0010589FAC|nr:hypothetical protein [Hymenobacter radiodurans]
MKTSHKIVLRIAVLLIVSGIGGYFYARQLFRAPQNQLLITGLPATLPFVWHAEDTGSGPVAHAGLLVPVQVPGCSRPCYLQFDTGAPYSVLYANPLAALQQQYPTMRLAFSAGGDTLKNFRCSLGNGQVLARTVKVLPLGAKQLPEAGSNEHLIIGTLGTDFMDGRVLIINYPQQQITLATAVPDSLKQRMVAVPLTFESRRVLLTPQVEGKAQQLLFDSGSSAFALLTSRIIWDKLVQPKAPVQTTTVNSWGKSLTAHTAPTAAQLGFGDQQVALGTVTNIEGTSFVQNLMMRVSGMGGMLGNAPFEHHTVVMDVKGGRFGLVSP